LSSAKDVDKVFIEQIAETIQEVTAYGNALSELDLAIESNDKLIPQQGTARGSIAHFRPDTN
jgi:hypothetical protein